MDETTGSTVADSAGSNTGTAYGTTIVDGKYGKARGFNGSDYIRIPTSSSLQSVSSAITISLWIKDLGTPVQEWGAKTIFINNHIQNYGSPISGALISYHGDNTLSWQLRLNNICCQTLTSAAINPNNWHSIIAVWNGLTMTLYINR